MPIDMRIAASLLALTLIVPASSPAEDATEHRLDFKEVYELLKTQLSDFDEASMSDVAARGLIQELRPRVRLLDQEETPGAAGDSEPTLDGRVFDDAFGYVQLSHLSTPLAKAFDLALSGMKETNRLKGLILDLRFSNGTDYKAAANVADRFLATAQPLADWGNGLIRSTEKSDAIEQPVAVLVNAETAGAAELLAGILRESSRALIIGTPTAGEASMYRDFTLSTGQRLRIATQPIQVGQDATLDIQGLVPDIEVESDPVHARAWMEDPFHRIKRTEFSGNDATSDNPRRRLNEADLVRMLREGYLPEDLGAGETTTPVSANGPLVQDPVLARALDFLKGLSLVRPSPAK